MISAENLAQLRALIEQVLDERGLGDVKAMIREELERCIVKRKPPEDITAKRRAAAQAMLAKRRALAEQNAHSKKPRNGAGSRANAEQKRFVFPEWLEPDRDVWDAWVEARTKIKKPPTDWAKHLAVIKLAHARDAGKSVRRLLADAAFHNWQDFYETKDQ